MEQSEVQAEREREISWLTGVTNTLITQAKTKLESDTCDVVGYPAVSRLTALAQTTVPLMQQADVVLRKTCPEVPGRNCSHPQQHNKSVFI